MDKQVRTLNDCEMDKQGAIPGSLKAHDVLRDEWADFEAPTSCPEDPFWFIEGPEETIEE
jgi:hypothetical protein